MHRFLTNVFASLNWLGLGLFLNWIRQLHINSRGIHYKIIIVLQYPEKTQTYFQPFSWNLFSFSMLLQFLPYHPIHNTLLIKFIVCHMKLEENVLTYQLWFTNLVHSLTLYHFTHLCPYTRQLLDEVEQAIINYQCRGPSFLPKPKARWGWLHSQIPGLIIQDIMQKPNSIIVLLYINSGLYNVVC